MIDTFYSCPWHDTALLELLIDRRAPGERDEVRLRVAWPQGDEAMLLFRDCYAMTAEMNFGIVAEERIASASIVEDDLGLVSIRERWKALGLSLAMLSCYRIEMSSTASVIRVYANHFEIL